MATLDGTPIEINTGASHDAMGGMGGLGGILIGALLGGGLGGFGGLGRGGVGGAAGAAVASDLLISPLIAGVNNQINALSGQINSNQLSSEMESVENTFATISAGQTSANAANFNNVSSQIGNVQTAQAANNFTTLSSINGLGRDITAQNTQTLINTIQNFNQVQNSQQTATNQIISNLNAMSAQNAACCCDLKQAISNDGNATRALINDLNVQNLQGQLNDAKLQISNTNQTIALENFAATLVAKVTAPVV